MQKRRKLILWRMDNNLRQVQIIKKLGISSGYYSNLERARVNPSFDLLMRFRDVFEVDDVLDLFEVM